MRQGPNTLLLCVVMMQFIPEAISKKELLNFYLDEWSYLAPVDPETFKSNFEMIAFQRNLQILGAYAFLSRVKGKTYFEQYIPAALASFRSSLPGT